MSTPYFQYNDFGMRGLTLYLVLDDPNTGYTWNGTAFADSPARTLAAVALTEYQTGRFRAAVPAGINAPRLLLATVYQQAGGTPADTTDIDVGSGLIEWNGSAFASKQDPLPKGALADIVVTTAGHNLLQVFQVFAAGIAGVSHGEGTTHPTYNEMGGSSVVIDATLDNAGNRTAVVLTIPTV